jgi:translation initiation factor 5B
MPPKKKANKKANDDWEADLGDTVNPVATAPKEEEPKVEVPDDDPFGGGLMASIQRRGKKAKKNQQQDFVQGEDPTADEPNGHTEPAADLAAKAPQEATMDDEDIFSAPVKKGKGKPAKLEKAEEPQEPEEEDEAGGKVKTKAQKEKEKKEKEKQRKKELV